jgi:thioesterase domain-containing protein
MIEQNRSGVREASAVACVRAGIHPAGQVADIIAVERWSAEGRALVPTQPRGSKTPLFWVHGDASSGFLASYLDPDQPLYALDKSQDRQAAHYTTVEGIAGHYLDKVRSIQAAGPYLLGGFSFGGTVAFEMAQQLRRTGETVALLVLLDSPFPGGGMDHSVGSETERGFSAKVRRHSHDLALLPCRAWLPYAMVRLTSRLNTLTRTVTLEMVHWAMVVRSRQLIPGWLLGDYLFGVYRSALGAYTPHCYPGRVVYIKSETRSADDRTCWVGLIGEEMECHEVPGGHLDIVTQPYANSWAEKLKVWLRQAQNSAAAA